MALPNAFSCKIIDERLNLGEQKPVEKTSRRRIVEPSMISSDRNEPFLSQVRKTKRRRSENVEQQDIAALQMNTSQSLQAIVDGVVGDKCQPEDGTFCGRSDFSKPDESVDLIDDRLNVLQRLVPRGSEVDREEILKVVVDYVKALEREIQMFQDSEQNVPATILSNLCVTGKPGDSMDTPSNPEVNFLQERGLCIVPLSILSKAF